MTELRVVTCHMGSHSFTCHPTQVNAELTYRLPGNASAGSRTCDLSSQVQRRNHYTTEHWLLQEQQRIAV